jgi:hypothetical protein
MTSTDLDKKKDSITAILKSKPNPSSDKVIEQYVDELLSVVTNLLNTSDEITSEIDKVVSLLEQTDSLQYVNHACELSATNSFKLEFPKGFRYQVENTTTITSTGKSKSFDFSFFVDTYQFNTEVKNFARKETNQGRDPVKLFLPRDQSQLLYDQGLRPDATCKSAIRAFLKDANDQLQRPSNGLSVMLLCCNSFDEYADAMECFIGPHGIIQSATPENPQTGNVSYPDIGELPNIDAVVICNLGFFHRCVIDTAVSKDSYKDGRVSPTDGAIPWSYKGTLPIGFPLREEKHSNELLKVFADSFHMINGSLSQLCKKHSGNLQAAIFELINLSLDQQVAGENGAL